jgi:quercetin dioxygenase-like cupin family protein
MKKVVAAIYLTSVCLSAVAELPAGVVPITSEPDHKVRFENGKVRIIEAHVPEGKKTLFHEHRYDGFFVFFKADGFVNEPYKGTPISPNLPAGAVQFIPANKPYIHRVGASGDQEVYVSVVELLSPARSTKKEADERFPPFVILMENSRGRMYRLRLNPGESSDKFTRPAGTAMFAITSGKITEKPHGKPTMTWDLAPGKFRWTDSGEELTLKNEGQTPVELVEIEVF